MLLAPGTWEDGPTRWAFRADSEFTWGPYKWPKIKWVSGVISTLGCESKLG